MTAAVAVAAAGRAEFCRAGHPWDEANTGRNPDGSRRCRACAAARQRRNYYRRAGRAVPLSVVRLGDPPPPDWVDWVVVERLVRGREAPGREPTRDERRAAAVALHRQGTDVSDIARVLGMSKHTVLAVTGAHPAAAADPTADPTAALLGTGDPSW